jgi:peptide/nickel transport system substrate-binding protein
MHSALTTLAMASLITCFPVNLYALESNGEPAATSTDGGIPSEAWPQSWFQAPKTASELGIQEFRQSPVLDAQVASGKLPPVAERLPDDPMVIEPFDDIGVYGGTAEIFDIGTTLLNPPEGPYRVGPQLRLNLPNFAESTEFSDSSRTVTITLRKGLKWSDGHPLTAADFVFDLEHIEMNTDLTPVVLPLFKGARIEVHAPHKFSYHFPTPRPLLLKYMAHSGDRFLSPAHFLKRYHPAFTDTVQLEREAVEEGLQDWRKYFEVVNSTGDLKVYHRPVFSAFVVVSKTSTRSRYRRNPYYYKIDPEGNQLPYIDFLEVQKVDNKEMMAAKASTGQVTLAGRQLMTADIPLFKRLEEKNGYTTYIWPRCYGSDVVFQLNITHPDERLRRIFGDVRFRRAMSIAINRDEINDIIYYGRAVPRQLTVVPSSAYFEPEFPRAYAQFDPQRASALFDEIGLLDRDGDGQREGPDGEPLNITLEYGLGETPKQSIVELAVAHWREVGMHISYKQLSGNLLSTRAKAGLMDMTLWHADRQADILFPIEPFWFVPMHIGQEQGVWSKWSRWYLSHGERGWKPPPEAMQLIEWWERLRRTSDESERLEMGKNILRSQAENIWGIGIAGLAPHPVIVRDDLKNVPNKGYWGWDSRWSWPYYPETWYLEPKPQAG